MGRSEGPVELLADVTLEGTHDLFGGPAFGVTFPRDRGGISYKE